MSEKDSENERSSLYRGRLSFRPLLSSTGLGWKGLVVERYQAPPCELPDLPIAHHIVELASQQHVSLGERPDWRGHLRPFSKYPGVCNCFPAGVRPRLRVFTRTNLIVCGLEPEFAEEVSEELDSNPAAQLRVQLDIRDESLGSLMRLLENAAKSAQPSDNLYVDHLIYAFTLRLFSLGQGRQYTCARQGALPAHKLRRVTERMNADLDTDLDLKTIAAESGYSRNHFLRMFRVATECTPHQYFLRLRIEKAQSLMKDRSLRIIDIAESCGFASQSQFSRVFRRIIGVTPRQYRRDSL
ncbi:MAG: transcriptional regulator, AraC family [Gammaproteobacteria bacterium]|jgi:AraC family transcriptional regulator|nr:transcriptional regulator, AraC family [Gammaproteobacteria bacterium]